jgi:hypothetical protein
LVLDEAEEDVIIYDKNDNKIYYTNWKKGVDKPTPLWYNKGTKREREDLKMKKWYEIHTKYYTFPFFMLPLYPIAWIREKIIEKSSWQTNPFMIL